MIFAHQIRQVVADYLSRDLDLDGLLHKFSPMSYNIQKDSQPEAIRLANAIEICLADIRAGCVGEAQFRATLRELVSMDTPNIFIHGLSFASTVNQYSAEGMANPGASPLFGTTRETEPGSIELHQA